MTIKNIIFDLGGVLLNIDFDKTKRAFESLGVKDFDSFYTKESANPVFEALETGHINREEFYGALQRYCYPGTSFSQIQTAWNDILIDFRKESIAALSQLATRYRMYLLSNTNRIHQEAFTAMFEKDFEGKIFDSHFTKAYYSHQMNRRKPYPETYSYVINDAGIIAAETLFIDDSLANIEGAQQVGLQTKILLPEERIEMLGL